MLSAKWQPLCPGEDELVALGRGGDWGMLSLLLTVCHQLRHGFSISFTIFLHNDCESLE